MHARAAVSTPAPTLELLRWLASRRASYDEALAVWASHCPRLTVWEDALIEGLVRIERTPTAMVVLTERGRAALDA